MKSLLALLVFTLSASAAPITFTPPQQESVNKLTAKGGLVMQLAADADTLVVNLSLAGKAITDAEVAEVKNLPKVSQLNLANTAVSDAGIATLSGLTDLTMLHLEKTAITDAALANLKGLAKLEYLNLYGTSIGDAGLAHLSGLKNLKKLYLWQTKVTDKGVEELKKAIPAVVVNRGEELKVVVVAPPVETAAKKTVNSVCPISNKPVDASFTFAFEGKTVGFCCGDCCKKFAADPKAYSSKIKVDAPAAKPAPEKKPVDKKDDKKPAATAAPVNSKCPVSDKAVDAKFTFAYEGKTVGFCCGNCCKKFAGDPKPYAGKIVADVK